jgi:hypothetical protein
MSGFMRLQRMQLIAFRRSGDGQAAQLLMFSRTQPLLP